MRAKTINENIFKSKDLEGINAIIYKAMSDLKSVGFNVSLETYKTSRVFGKLFAITLTSNLKTNLKRIDVRYKTEEFTKLNKAELKNPDAYDTTPGWYIIGEYYGETILIYEGLDWDEAFKKILENFYDENVNFDDKIIEITKEIKHFQSEIATRQTVLTGLENAKKIMNK